MYAVILAGGGGTRLWPLSTPERPKPFIPLLGEETLFQRTIHRLEGDEVDLKPGDIVVVTERRYAPFVRAQARGVAVLEEPTGRNTAAAIALATVAFDRPDDEVMLVLPADHTIDDEPMFRGVIRDAEAGVARGAFGIESPLVTLGIQVDRPATEYGYLIPALARGETAHRLQAYPLEAFEEKPGPRKAAELAARAGVAWNAGMFLWRRRAIRDALRSYAPSILDSVVSGVERGELDAAYEAIGELGPVRRLSIDYQVMERAARAGQVVMAAMNVGWSDLGSWTALLSALRASPMAAGRVIPAGEVADVRAGDLTVRRVRGRLSVEPGPARGILDADGPSALLTDARADRDIVEALLRRVTHEEARS